MRATWGVVSARRPMHAARQLVDQLEGLQVERFAGAGEQRFQVLEQRRHDQLVAIAAGGVEQFASKFFDVAGLGRQHIGNVIRQDPGGHGDRGRWLNRDSTGAALAAMRLPTALIQEAPRAAASPGGCCTARRSAAARRAVAAAGWKPRRQPPGDRKGSRPSSTRTSASALQKVSLSKRSVSRQDAGAAAAAALPLLRNGLEELGSRRDRAPSRRSSC